MGEILECPKCGSMVLISPPEGWVLPEEPPVTPLEDPLPAKATGGNAPPAPLPNSAEGLPVAKKSASGRTVIDAPPPARDFSAEAPSPRSSTGDSGIGRGGLPVAREAASESPAVKPPPVQLPVSVAAGAEVAAMAALPPSGPPPPPPAPAGEPVAAASATANFTPFELPEVVAGQTYLSSFARSVWGRAAALVLSGLIGLGGVLAVWTVLSARHRATDPRPADETAQVESTAPASAEVAKAALPRSQFNRRWLPRQTVLFVDLRLSRLSKQSPAMDALAFLGPWWQPSSEALLADLNLGPEQVRRLTWASTDLVQREASCVVVLELEDGIDAAGALPMGESVDLGANLVARRPQGGRWPHPLLAVNAHTVVTGSEEALRQLVARGRDGDLASRPMELLLKKISSSGDLAVLMDLSAPGSAAENLPTDLLDVWPAGKAKWRLLCETPVAFGLSAESAASRRCELGLVCKDEKTALRLRGEVEKLAPEVIAALPAHIAAVKDALPSAKFSDEAVDRYRRLLDELLRALRISPLRYRRRRGLAAAWLGRARVAGIRGGRRPEFGGPAGRLAGGCSKRG